MTTQSSNLSCLLYGPHDARFEDRQVPTIRDPYDVIIRIGYVGVCGSDVSNYLPTQKAEDISSGTQCYSRDAWTNTVVRSTSGTTAESVSKYLQKIP